VPIPAPRGTLRRKVIAWGACATAVAVATGFLVDLTAVPKIVCGIPGVRMVCGELGIGGAPSRAEEALWSGRRAGDCSALRSYLSKFPNGAYAGEAHARLAAAMLETKETWTPEERRLPLVVRSAIHPLPSGQAARTDALARAREEARRACVGFDQAEFRLLSALPVPL